MYSFISGRVVSATEGTIVIENNGIGYELTVSNSTLSVAGIVGKSLQLYTYLQVKEDLMALYGFATKEEKSMFLKLISISGVGPKMAMQVLSGLDLNALVLAIVTGDTKTLSKAKGLGKKTAERIILELREQVGTTEFASAPIGGSIVSDNTIINDAVFALVTLGLNKSDAYTAVVKASERSDKLEEIITIALRSLDFRG
ncbi:MAG: Holliday junction branch migration protein RuvA [Clostridia bacterium]